MGRSGARPLLLCSPYSPPLSQSVSRDNDDDNGGDNDDDNDIITITKSGHHPHSAPLS